MGNQAEISETGEQRQRSNMRFHILGIFALLTAAVAVFYDVLFTANPRVLSSETTDLATQYIYWRQFGFGELAKGNLALWNPHVFSGIPFFGGFQAALLYPLNAVYLLLPPANAVNTGIVLHIFLTGLFMYLWAWQRGLRPLACWLTGVLLMFCGSHFMHIYAGHLSNLCAMPWVPLVFLSIDGIYAKRSVGWVLVGTAAVAMLILAGHPQYVFYTAVAAGIYCVLCIIKEANRVRVITLLAGMAAGAILLTSVQLLTGLQETAYSVRSEGAIYRFAAMFSFPPENLLTLLVPDFFGSLNGNSYWGRCYLWEMSLFFSVTGLALAIYGGVCGTKQQRRFAVTMIVVLFILALGAHTPLFRLLYAIVPGFDKFRGNSKFTYQMIVFVIMLAGVGFHQLLKNKPSWRWVIALGITVVVAVAASQAISASAGDAGGWWQSAMKSVYEAGRRFGESYQPPQNYDDIIFVENTGRHAANGLLVAAGVLALVAGLFALLRRFAGAKYLLAILALLELFVFIRPLRPTFDLQAVQFSQLKQMLDRQAGDYRIFNTLCANSAMATGAKDIWGFDPGTLKRYAEFMTFTQTNKAEGASQYVQFSRLHRLFGMLRLKYVVVQKDEHLEIIDVREEPLPRLVLLRQFEVRKNTDEILSAMDSPLFDFRRKVILESQPQPLPTGEAGTVRIVSESTDELVIEADVPEPTILLITDAYHPNWRCEALPASSQSEYKIMPANYVLRAVPLKTGHHHFKMEYKPSAFVIGKWISIIFLAAYISLCILLVLRKNKTNPAGKPAKQSGG